MNRSARVLVLLSVVVWLDLQGPEAGSAALFASVPGGNDSLLVRIDEASGAASAVGPISTAQIQGLAYRPSDGALFGSAGILNPNEGTIVRIDPTTGAGVVIGPPGDQPNGQITDLAFSRSNVLYGACERNGAVGVADSVCSIDQTTGIANLVVVLKINAATLRGIAGLAFDGNGGLYGSIGSFYTGGPTLFVIDLFTGQATEIGKIRDSGGTQISAGVIGLAFDHSTLYGATADGRIVTIDPGTGIFAPVGTIGIAGAAQALAAIDLPGAPTPTPTNPASPCTQAAPQNPCIAGGTGGTDCYLEWFVAGPVQRNRKGLPKGKVICYEGDPRCDFDNDLGNRRCTFRTSICINNTDPRLGSCAPVDLLNFEAKAPSLSPRADAADIANLNTLETSAGTAGFGVTLIRQSSILESGRSNNALNTCSQPLDIVVPLRQSRSGTMRRSTRMLRIRGTTSLGKRDADSVRLECRPSTCGDGVVQPNEQCDDGNRMNGDHCNQGCQIETATPTPTITPSARNATQTPTPARTATETPTAGPPTETATVTGTPTISGTPTVSGTPTDTPTPGGSACGNGLLESDETCATCAADCTVLSCTASGLSTFQVNWAPPPGQPVSVIRVRLGYRSNLVSLPGSGSSPSGRVKNKPSNAIVSLNDLDYALQVLVSKSGSLPAGRLFTVDFDRCQGALAPAVSDFSCVVEDCGSSFGSVDGCTCAVAAP